MACRWVNSGHAVWAGAGLGGWKHVQVTPNPAAWHRFVSTARAGLVQVLSSPLQVVGLTPCQRRNPEAFATVHLLRSTLVFSVWELLNQLTAVWLGACFPCVFPSNSLRASLGPESLPLAFPAGSLASGDVVEGGCPGRQRYSRARWRFAEREVPALPTPPLLQAPLPSSSIPEARPSASITQAKCRLLAAPNRLLSKQQKSCCAA